MSGKTMYKRIRTGPKTTRDEHRLIMEKQIGRPLERHEFVHHIDENKSNNNVNNLQILTRADHARLHAKGFPAGKGGLGNRGKIGAANALFKLSSEQVEEVKLLIGTTSSRKIATLYGVTHNVIRRIKKRLDAGEI